MAIPPFSPIRAFLANACATDRHQLIEAWLLEREGWNKENIERLSLHLGGKNIPFQIMLEALRIRDLDLMSYIPYINEPYHHRKVLEEITRGLLENREQDRLIEMARKYLEINDEARHYLSHLLHETASKGRLDLLKKIIPALEVPRNITRQYIPIPFDQSIGAKDEREKAKFREMITLLDPTFEMPEWLLTRYANK